MFGCVFGRPDDRVRGQDRVADKLGGKFLVFGEAGGSGQCDDGSSRKKGASHDEATGFEGSDNPRLGPPGVGQLKFR